MYGLILEGGGTKGAFHIGAFKALQDMGIKVGLVAGTSIGALNGAMIVQDRVEDAYRLWEEIKPSMILDVDDEKYKEILSKNLQNTEIREVIDTAKKLIQKKGIGKSNMQELVTLNVDEKKLRNSAIEFGMVTVSVKEKKAIEIFVEDIPDGQLPNYIMASANYPLFQREEIGGEKFIDGGIANNLPINMAIEKGYKDIIAIRTNEKGTLKGREKKYEESINIKYIYPSENLGGVLNFDEDNAKKNLKLGYYDTIKAFKSLKGDKYYISKNENQEIYFQILANMSDEKIDEIGEIFGIYYHCPKRMLFEFIIPELARLLKLEEDYDYEDLVIGVLEEVAYRFQVERFKVYTVREFFEEISRNYKYDAYNSFKSENMIKKIMEKELFNIRSKEEIMMMVFNIVKDIVEIP